MNRTEKADLVNELKETLSRVTSVVVADYRGLTVEQLGGVRREIRRANCSYRVLKNTLIKRAIAGTALEPLSALLEGPTALAYSTEDPDVPAKIIDKFSATMDKLVVKGGYVEGKMLDPAGVKQLAKMKGKDEMRAALLALFQAPAQSFVRLMAAAPQNFVYVLRARERSLSQENG